MTPPGFALLDLPLRKRGREQSYDVFVKDIDRVGGKVKSARFVKANNRPLTRAAALDLGADITDNSIAQTFKIQKRKGTIQSSQLSGGSGFFGFNRGKFRETFIRKGRLKKQPDKFIEKRGFAIDTFGERQGLRASQLIARRRSVGFLGQPKPKKTKARKTKKKKSKRSKRRSRDILANAF